MTRHPLAGLGLVACLLLAGPGDRAAPARAGGPDAGPRAPGRHALEFDGESSFVWLRQAVPDGLAQGTVELWFRLDRPWEDGPQMPLIGDDGGRLNLVLRDGRLVFNKNMDNTPFEIALGPARLSAGWHHIAGTWGDAGMKLFLDGKLVASHPDTHPYQRARNSYGIEDPGVGGGAPRAAEDRADGAIERGEVEALDVGPDGAGGVVGREQGIQGQGAIDDLIALGPPEPGPPDTDRGDRHGLVGRG